jgi:CarboxypepD_reg-like domain
VRRVVRLAAAILLLAYCLAVQAAEIKGKVTNAAGGEALGRIHVSVQELKLETTTRADGTFSLEKLPSGTFTLQLSAVGYRLMNVAVTISNENETQDLALVMVPDNFRRTETVEVRADVFQAEDSPAVLEQNLTSSEIREASTVLADDPFRAVQALPGVSASGNNELLAEFSVMGAPFGQVGIYLDDVLIPSPFHEDSNVPNGASLSLLTGELVESMKLLPVAYPVRYADEIGAALDIRTRDGSRSRPFFRASVGVGYSDVVGEGRIGPGKRGSWLFSARRSYIGYIVHHLIGNDFADVSFYDGEGKVVYDLTAKQSVSLYALGGHTYINDSSAAGKSEVRQTKGDLFLYRAGWRWNASPRFFVDTHGAFLREPIEETNPSGQVLQHNAYSEWSVGGHALWAWSRNATLEAGGTARRPNSTFYQNYASPLTFSLKSWLGDGYLQQSATLLHSRVHLTGGARMDGVEHSGQNPLSPQASGAIRVARATEVQLGYARYTKPDTGFVSLALSPGCFQRGDPYELADHYTAGVEQRMGESTRVRVQVFDRELSSQIVVSRPSPCPYALFPGTHTIGKNYSRGMQVMLQRRSANRLSGWIGYTYVQAGDSGRAVVRPGVAALGPYYASSADQPHSVNAFAVYRLRPTVNLGAKFLFGSGFPSVGGYRYDASGMVVPNPPTRIPDYLRADFRVDKSWAFKRWKMTLYGEVLNFTNHYNVIVDSVIPEPNGSWVLQTQRALPVTPTVGMAFEF